MIIQDAEVAGKHPQAKAYLRKLPDGIVVVVNDKGELIGSTSNVALDNGVGQVTTATVTIAPDGWYEDLVYAD